MCIAVVGMVVRAEPNNVEDLEIEVNPLVKVHNKTSTKARQHDIRDMVIASIIYWLRGLLMQAVRNGTCLDLFRLTSSFLAGHHTPYTIIR